MEVDMKQIMSEINNALYIWQQQASDKVNI